MGLLVGRGAESGSDRKGDRGWRAGTADTSRFAAPFLLLCPVVKLSSMQIPIMSCAEVDTIELNAFSDTISTW